MNRTRIIYIWCVREHWHSPSFLHTAQNSCTRSDTWINCHTCISVKFIKRLQKILPKNVMVFIKKYDKIVSKFLQRPWFQCIVSNFDLLTNRFLWNFYSAFVKGSASVQFVVTKESYMTQSRPSVVATSLSPRASCARSYPFSPLTHHG